MRFYSFFLIVIALGSIAVGIALLPGAEEQYAMLAHDHHYRKAFQELRRQYAAGRRDARTVLELHKMHVHFGNLDEATQTLERYVALRPDDESALEQLVAYYRNTNQREAYVRALGKLFEMAPSDSVYERLLGVFQLAGNVGEERALLEKGMELDLARPEDFARLGMLEARRGRPSRSIALLKQADERLPPDARTGRTTLFNLLIEAGNEEDAYRRAAAWSNSWKDPDLVIEYMSRLAEAGRFDLVRDLASEHAAPGNEVMLAMARLWLDRGNGEEAARLLRDWSAGGLPPDLELSLEAIGIAEDAEDIALALDMAQRLGMQRMPRRAFVSLAEISRQFADRFGFPNLPAGPLASLVEHLAREKLGRNETAWRPPSLPGISDGLVLFGAQAALALENRALAVRLVGLVEPVGLSPGELESWVSVQYETGSRERVAAHLGALSRAGQLPEELLPTLNEIIRRDMLDALQDRAGHRTGPRGE